VHGENKKNSRPTPTLPTSLSPPDPPVHVNQTICLFVCGCYMVITSNTPLSRMYKLQGNAM